MGDNSIFGKINQIKDNKAESVEVNKQKMYQEVRLEIEELKKNKQSYLDLYEKIQSQKEELSTNHVEYKNALKEVLAVFENEEASTILADQGVGGVKDLLNNHSDTDEAKNLQASEISIKENIANLKKMKADVINMFNIENPDYQSLKGVMGFLQIRVDTIDREIFDKSIDTPEGRDSWLVRYPTGAFHKETDFEKNIKENKEPKLREIYHELGDNIDSAFVETIKEYKPNNSNEAISLGDDYREGTHIISRGSIGVENNVINFHFGGGYSSLDYEIIQNNQGKLFFSRKDDYKALLNKGFLEIFNKKLHQIDENFKSKIENI